MRIGWLSFHTVGGKALKYLLEDNRLINAVITLSDKESLKRSSVFDYSSLCTKYNLPLFKIDHINSDQSFDLLSQLNLDILFVIGWSQIIEKKILDIPKLGMVGVHSSLLPSYRGSAPVNWAIINGEKKTGTTLMLLSEGIDSGDIIDQTSFPITLYDSCKTIYDKVSDANAKMIVKFYDNLHSGNFNPIPQGVDTLEAIMPRRRPEDGLIDWNKPSIVLYNFIRAQTFPYPGAFSYLNNSKYFILQCSICPKLDVASTHIAGEIIGPIHSTNQDACGIMIKCKDGYLSVIEIANEKGEIIKGQMLSEFFNKGSIFTSKRNAK